MAAAIVTAAGCGLRVDHRTVLAEYQAGPAETTTVAPPGAAGPGVQPSAGVTAAPDTTAAPGSTPTIATVPGAPTASTIGPNVGPKGSASAGSHSTRPSSAVATSTTPASGAPIVIGTTGSYSGVSNIGIGPRDTLYVWAKWVNSQGGIAGHPVQVVAEDNASDDNRALADVQDLVGNHHAVAITMAPGADIASFLPYLQQKQVPVAGGFAESERWWQSPIAFPSGSAASAVGFDSAIAQGAHKKIIAVLYCAESAVCKENGDKAAAYAPKLGLTVKYEASVSIATPDFTASCIQAQSRGVEALIVFADAATVTRLANNCDNQGYHPTYAALGDDTLAAQPSLQGMVSASDTFAWTDTSTPATAAYQQAMDAYGPKVPRNAAGADAWAGAEEIRKALEGAAGPVTGQTVLAGLWKMRNETLGGLVPGMTFVKGANATPNYCTQPMIVQNKKWTAQGPRVCTPP
ncbi:MAG TPA: ABC transporter substrate-binding protein [Mycobacteriales bacterium]|nr:ABC transporter substrate-binding protein [Mycobacteriales bacterium]